MGCGNDLELSHQPMRPIFIPCRHQPAPAISTKMCPPINLGRLSPGETCRIVDRRSMAERENVARGLVPRWGRSGAWQNPPCQLAIPNHNSGFSHLGAPATAGMSDCYESMSRIRVRDRLPPLISSFQRSKARPVPRYGAGIQKGWRSGGRRTRATLSRYGQFRHNLRSLFDHNLQTRRTNCTQI